MSDMTDQQRIGAALESVALMAQMPFDLNKLDELAKAIIDGNMSPKQRHDGALAVLAFRSFLRDMRNARAGMT